MKASSAFTPAIAFFRFAMSCASSACPTYLIGPLQICACGRTWRFATSAPERAASITLMSS